MAPSTPLGWLLKNVFCNLRKKETKSVIKTVSLPQWLAIMAEEAGISYSQALQEALKDRLGL